jgi:hypothetical protein
MGVPMFGLVVGALVARRAQAIWLAVLATVAVMAASAAPWYHAAALASVTDADVTSAPAAQRTVLATSRLSVDDVTGSSPLPAARQAAARLLDMPGSTVVLGAQFLGTFSHGSRTVGALLAYRDDVCAHLHVDGACPVGADEVVMSAATADQLGVTRGDEIDVLSLRLSQRAGYRVVGIYETGRPGRDLLGTDRPAEKSRQFSGRPDVVAVRRRGLHHRAGTVRVAPRGP